MRILAVDTSSTRGSVCIVEDGELLGEIRLASSIQHSDRLFRSIEFLFQYVPFTLADIDLFAAARGPGSFTGLRIGLAATEGFVAAHGKPGCGISTLEALAWKLGIHDSWIAPTIDARRGEVYGAVYRREPDRLIEEQSPLVLKPEHWFSLLPKRPLRICGDGADRYRDLIQLRPEWTIHKVDPYLAGAIAELALTSNAGPLEPLYVRKTDAEIAREKLHHESIAGPNT
jgi:tRNA threonylcarbamoyladenosine biosynthesis protein TsaB